METLIQSNKLSDLIEKLTQLKDKVGDLNLASFTSCGTINTEVGGLLRIERLYRYNHMNTYLILGSSPEDY